MAVSRVHIADILVIHLERAKPVSVSCVESPPFYPSRLSGLLPDKFRLMQAVTALAVASEPSSPSLALVTGLDRVIITSHPLPFPSADFYGWFLDFYLPFYASNSSVLNFRFCLLVFPVSVARRAGWVAGPRLAERLGPAHLPFPPVSGPW